MPAPIPTQIPSSDALGVPKSMPYRKIPKPPGELTRLSRGGYSLERALGWDQERYRKVQVSLLLAHTTHLNLLCMKHFVNDQARAHLQPAFPFKEQNKTAMKIVCENVSFITLVHLSQVMTVPMNRLSRNSTRCRNMRTIGLL